MLIPSPLGTVDTADIESNIDGALSLIPVELQHGFRELIEDYKLAITEYEQEIDDVNILERQLSNAKQIRDEAQTHIDNLLNNVKFDRDTKSAIKFIRSVLDTI